MTTAKKDSTHCRAPRPADPFAELKARVEAVGGRLFKDALGELYIAKGDDLVALRLNETTIEREIEALSEWRDEEPAGEQSATVASPNVAKALDAIERADRLLNLCRVSVEALKHEHSWAIADTMGFELFEAIDAARSALKGGAA